MQYSVDKGKIVYVIFNTQYPLDRFQVTSHFLKSKTKDPRKFLSSSGKRGGIFIYVFSIISELNKEFPAI